MRKLLNNPWFVGAMALIALGFVIRAVLPSRPIYAQGGAEASDGSTTESGPIDAGDASAVSIPVALKALSIPSIIRDPFSAILIADKTSAPSETSAPADSVDTVHLSAVWIQQGTALAIINGRIAESGEEFGRLKVESTTSDGVWFSHWKGRNFVSVGGDFSLSTPANQQLTTTSPL
jgi:hypothetical protein